MKTFVEKNIYFLAPFLLSAIGGFLLIYRFGVATNDSLLKSFNAVSIIQGDQFFVRVFGLVWPPIPVVARVLPSFMPFLAKNGLSGALVTSFFFGLTIVWLKKIFDLFKVKKKNQLIFICLYILNPLVLLYAINGAGETIWLFFVIMCIFFFIRYAETIHLKFALGLASSLALAALTREETIALIPAFSLLTAYIIFRGNKLNKIRKIEAIVILLATPVIFLLFVLILANWLITRNAIFFFNYEYLNCAPDTLNCMQLFTAVKHNAFSFFLFSHQYLSVSWFNIVLIGLLIGKATKEVKKIIPIGLIVLQLAIINFFIFNGLLFNSETILRNVLFTIPFSFISLSYIYGDKKLSALMYVFIFLSLVSSIITFKTMQDPRLAPEEYTTYNILRSGTHAPLLQEENRVADYIAKSTGNKKILTEYFTGFKVVYVEENQQKFLMRIRTTQDLHLKELLEKKKVGYILLPKSEQPTNWINKWFPELKNNKVKKRKDFNRFSLYSL